MPHDKFGYPISVGDKVMVRFEVKQVFGGDENTACNVNLETLETMEGGYKTSLSNINTRMTEKIIVPGQVGPPE